MLTQSLFLTGLAALVAADKQNNPGYYGNQGNWPQGGGSYQPQKFDGNQRFPQQGGGGYDSRLMNGGGNWRQGGGNWPQGGGNWGGNGIPTNQQQQQQQHNGGGGGGFYPDSNQQQQQQQQHNNGFGGSTQQQQQQQQITLNINTAPTTTSPHYQKPDINLNRLTPYSTSCTQLGFDPDIDVTIIEIDIKQVQCQAFGDPQGQQPVGGIFGYENPSDLGEEPVQVESILCSVGGCGDGC